MGILSGSNIGVTGPHSLPSPPDSLPSPARGSPAGISPNKSLTGVTPELSGLERMFGAWRRDAEKKAQQFRQQEADAAIRRQKEQQEVNEIRSRLIGERMKKLEQQQQAAGKSAKINGPILAGDVSFESTRKRKSDDDFGLGTPSDSGYSYGSPDSFVDGGACSSQSGKGASNRGPTPLPAEKNASVVIETFQLPSQAPSHMQRHPVKRPKMMAPIPPGPTFPVSNQQFAMAPFAAPFGMDPVPSAASSMPSYPQYMPNDRQAAPGFRGQANNGVMLPNYLEEEIIMSHDLNDTLTPDFLKACANLDSLF